MKKCTKCKGLGPFSRDKNQKDGLCSWCKECTNAARRVSRDPEKHRQESAAYRAADPEGYRQYKSNYRKGNSDRVRGHYLKHRYGVSLDTVRSLLKAQGGCCAICSRPLTLEGKGTAIDHDHTTGLVRGVLCICCNTGIGMLQDTPKLLLNAYNYLTQIRSKK